MVNAFSPDATALSLIRLPGSVTVPDDDDDDDDNHHHNR